MLLAKNRNCFVIGYLIFLILVSSIPGIFKELFVHPSGKISVIGPGISVLLSLGIYYRYKNIRTIFYLFFTLLMIFDAMVIINIERKYLISFGLLSLCHIVLLLTFIFSKSILKYLNAETEK